VGVLVPTGVSSGGPGSYRGFHWGSRFLQGGLVGVQVPTGGSSGCPGSYRGFQGGPVGSRSLWVLHALIDLQLINGMVTSAEKVVGDLHKAQSITSQLEGLLQR